jgi:TRAP-type C4-dicarboxylate transport system permease large subunit
VVVIGALIAVTIVLCVAFSAIAGSQPAARAGCHHEVVAMTTGGATVERCGPTGR